MNKYDKNKELIKKWRSLTAELNRKGIDPNKIKFERHLEIYEYVVKLVEVDKRKKKESLKLASIKYPYYSHSYICNVYYKMKQNDEDPNA